jgi:tetratricopeptide (TPR) repeat protein
MGIGLTMLIAVVYTLSTVSAELQSPYQATALEVQARTSSEEGNHVEAATLFKQAAEAFAVQSDSISQARGLVESGKSQIELRNYDEALIVLDAAESIYKETPDAPQLDKGICLWQKGRVLVYQSNKADALVILQRAVKILQSLPASKSETAGCLRSISAALVGLNRHEEGLSSAQAALEIFEGLAGTEKDQASCLLNMGASLLYLKRYKQSIEKHEKALAIYMLISNTEREQAMCLGNLGTALDELGQPAEALEKYKAAHTLFASLPYAEKERALSHKNIGVALRNIGRPTEALEQFDAAWALFLSLPYTEADQADLLINAGNAQGQLGQPAEALEKYKAAYTLLASLPYAEKEQARCLDSIGNALHNLGQYAEALEKHKEAFALITSLPHTEQDQAECLINMGITLAELNSYAESIKCYKEALVLYAALPDTEKDQADCLINMGNTLAELNSYAESIKCYEEALVLYVSLPDTEKEQADCLYKMGRKLVILDRYGESIKHYEEALALYVALQDTEEDRAKCLHAMGASLADWGHLVEALEPFDAALSLYSELPNTELKRAVCHLSRGDILAEAVGYEKSVAAYEAALELFATLPNSDYLQAGCLDKLGVAQKNLGRYEEALKNHAAALEMYVGLSDTQEDQAVCLTNIGVALSLQGRFPEALARYDAAFELCAMLPGTEKLNADLLSNSGVTLRSLGRYEEALDKLEAASDLYAALPDSGKNCLVNMGLVLMDLERYETALEKFEAALAFYAALPDSEADQASCLVQMGTTLSENGDNIEALKRYEAALTLMGTLPDNERLRGVRGTCLNNMGVALGDLGRHEESIDRRKEALILLSNLPYWEGDQAQCLYGIGMQNVARANWPDAIQHLYEGYFGKWKDIVPNLPFMTENQKSDFLLKRLPSVFPIYALSLLRPGLENAGCYGLDTTLLSKGLVEWALQQEQEVFLRSEVVSEDWKQEYRELQQWRREKVALAHALDNARLNPNRQGLSTAHEAWTRRMTALTECLEANEQNSYWRDVPFVTGPEKFPEVYDAQLRRLEEINEQIESREQDLARRNTFLGSEMRLRTANTEVVSAALGRLGNNTVLLEFLKYPEWDFISPTSSALRYGVYVLVAGSNDPIGIDLGPAETIDNALKAFRDAVEELPLTIAEKVRKGLRFELDLSLLQQMTTECAEAGATLRELIFDPVIPYLSGNERLFIAPDADLFLLPFEALPSPNPQDSGVRYLVEDYGFVYLNSGRELLRFVNRSQAGTANNTAVIVSDPDLKMSATDRAVKNARWLEARARGEVPEAQPWQGSFAAVSQPTSIHDTAGSGVGDSLNEIVAGLKPIGEAALTFTITVNDLLHNKQHPWCNTVVTYVGEEALEERVASLSSPRLLQILSHGVFIPLQEETYSADDLDARPREIENPLLRSMLALAGASVPTEGHIYHQENQFLTETEWLALAPAKREEQWEPIPLDDGHLTAYEVSGMKLYDTELVALTACSTALGDVGMGSSVAGLRRAFIAAGAHSMIMAQWEVPVLSSLNQMEQFYDAWLGKSFGRYDAFWESQKQALTAARKDFCGHPWFWAGFIYIGDPGERKADSSANQSS